MLLLGAVILCGTLFGLLPIKSRIERTTLQLQQAHITEQRLTRSILNLNTDLASIQIDDFSELIWQGQLTGEVTARIQARLGKVASDNDISLRSINSIPTQKMQSIPSIGLRVEGESDLAQLAMFLQIIETQTPVLIVTRANIRRVNNTREFSEQPALFFQLDISSPVLLEVE